MKQMYAYFRHFRINKATGELERYYQRGNGRFKPDEHGGMTHCAIIGRDGVILAEGRAVCSQRDAFNYRIGRDIARGRALKALENRTATT